MSWRGFMLAVERTMMRAGGAMWAALSVDWPPVGSDLEREASRAERAPERPVEPGATGLWRGRSTTPGRRGQVDTWCVKSGCASEGQQVTLWHVHEAAATTCHADSDGDCSWETCPQIRDSEPVRTGRHCPLDCTNPLEEI